MLNETTINDEEILQEFIDEGFTEQEAKTKAEDYYENLNN